ncbi:hypothetical protein BGZ61DRAFT_522519 [Ilyonectria robusta]|uniref:uncharacterized protein n=1 Tax=Ilyonectria robusta TaxID=1079257 RepID=UPI001E8CEADB|nr:uncharacterized protein BGZ61DRAFT_522519 [Ilyonectria robusta]KAH8665549.1 hypothetical protein BGZ61DRAFT_522519 [Ilyonectria robusta]
MHFFSIICSLVFLQGAMASPAAGPEPAPEVLQPRSVERRMPTAMDIPFPRFPSRNHNYNPYGGKGGGKGGNKGGDKGKDCAPTTQTNACSAGNPYCCSSDGKGGQVCQNTTACQQTVICCNNNNGFQICIGDMDFNQPITINIYND